MEIMTLPTEPYFDTEQDIVDITELPIDDPIPEKPYHLQFDKIIKTKKNITAKILAMSLMKKDRMMKVNTCDDYGDFFDKLNTDMTQE